MIYTEWNEGKLYEWQDFGMYNWVLYDEKDERINVKEDRKTETGYIYKIYSACDEIIYIGKTTNLHNRINQHKNNFYDFSYACWVSMWDIFLDQHEQYCILQDLPKYNKSMPFANFMTIDLAVRKIPNGHILNSQRIQALRLLKKKWSKNGYFFFKDLENVVEKLNEKKRSLNQKKKLLLDKPTSNQNDLAAIYQFLEKNKHLSAVEACRIINDFASKTQKGEGKE